MDNSTDRPTGKPLEPTLERAERTIRSVHGDMERLNRAIRTYLLASAILFGAMMASDMVTFRIGLALPLLLIARWAWQCSAQRARLTLWVDVAEIGEREVRKAAQ